MSINELHLAFKIELDKSNVSGYPSFLPEEIDYFINLAVTRFYKTRFSGANIHRTGFQMDQKRSDDFRNIVKRATLSLKSWSRSWRGNENCYMYPSDYWFCVGESVELISDHKDWPKDTDANFIDIKTDVLECTIENIDSRLNNTLSDHIFSDKNVRPLRVFDDSNIYLYTDGSYEIKNYIMSYISNPKKIDWYVDDKDAALTIVPEHAWDEIIALAVKAAIENISDFRYQTYSQETQVIE